MMLTCENCGQEWQYSRDHIAPNSALLCVDCSAIANKKKVNEYQLEQILLREFGETRSPIRAAFARGWRDSFNGIPESACPYHDARTNRNRVTFSRAFIRAWLKGWRHNFERSKSESE